MLSLGSSYLERLLVLLGVVAMDSLHSLHVFLDVTDSMLPCLESLSEQTGSLFKVWLVHVFFSSFLLKANRLDERIARREVLR